MSLSSHLRLPTILARASRSSIIGRHFSIGRLSLQAHRVPKRRRIGLQLLFRFLLESLPAVIVVGFGTRVIGRGL